MLDEVANEYVVLANTTVTFLARVVLGDLDEPVFSRLFTAEWESGEPLVATLTATLEDYFRDITNWLPGYFFAKFVHEVFTIAVGSYVMALRRLANGAFYFMNEVIASARVRRDEEILQEFFEKYDSMHMKKEISKTKDEQEVLGTNISAVSYELIGLKCMAVCITAFHVSSAEREIRILFKKYNGGKKWLDLLSFEIDKLSSHRWLETRTKYIDIKSLDTKK